jgi:hypothetical protein
MASSKSISGLYSSASHLNTRDTANGMPTDDLQHGQYLRRVSINDVLLHVQLREPDQGLEDEPLLQTDEHISTLLKPEFDDLPTNQLRVQHLDWNKFCGNILKYCGLTFSDERDEMGWIQEHSREGLHRKFVPISDELTFHNAIGLMLNASTPHTTHLNIHIFSPRPKEPVFRRSRRAPDATITPSSISATHEQSPVPHLGAQSGSSIDLQASSSILTPSPKPDFAMQPPNIDPELLQNPDSPLSDPKVIGADKSSEDVTSISQPATAQIDKSSESLPQSNDLPALPHESDQLGGPDATQSAVDYENGIGMGQEQVDQITETPQEAAKRIAKETVETLFNSSQPGHILDATLAQNLTEEDLREPEQGEEESDNQFEARLLEYKNIVAEMQAAQ